MFKRVASAIIGVMFIALSITLMCPAINYAQGSEDYSDEYIDGSKLTDLSEAEDTYTSLLRGTYLRGGTSRISNLGGGRVSVTGTTTAWSKVDTLHVTVYLEKYSGGTWKYVNSWVANASNNISVMKNMSVSITTGSYYRAKGIHRVTEGSKTEQCNSITDGIKIN